jgi:hypothetical protein
MTTLTLHELADAASFPGGSEAVVAVLGPSVGADEPITTLQNSLPLRLEHVPVAAKSMTEYGPLTGRP